MSTVTDKAIVAQAKLLAMQADQIADQRALNEQISHNYSMARKECRQVVEAVQRLEAENELLRIDIAELHRINRELKLQAKPPSPVRGMGGDGYLDPNVVKADSGQQAASFMAGDMAAEMTDDMLGR